jgi:hypothetical protein
MRDAVRFSFWICPHARFSVRTEEPWGVAHHYQFKHNCDICGLVSKQMFRPRDVGESIRSY